MRKMRTISLLLLDFYKTTHHDQYPDGLTKLVSYYTPRMSRLPEVNETIMFALQGFIQEYLIDHFNENFFNYPLADVVKEYERVLNNGLAPGGFNVQKVIDLHQLGYLPLQIKAIPEGTLVPIKVPMIEITNTHDNFAWLVNTIESLMSAELWHPQVAAVVGYNYRKIVNKYYDETVEDSFPRSAAISDFSFRGNYGLNAAISTSAAFCLSFSGTATVPAIPYLEAYYNCDSESELVVKGAISTEHSVMCSNASVDGDEKTFIRKLLTEIYPNHSFSMVSDSYDYWNVIDVILPELKDEVLAHNGTLFVRGDSGNPVSIVTETVFHLWETFGGTINSKGYKVLDSHIRAIYGDSITPQRAKVIYMILRDKGFSCENVRLGAGSFSMLCAEEEFGFTDDCGEYWEKDTLKYTMELEKAMPDAILDPFMAALPDKVYYPFTRDTFGVAVKATAGEVDMETIPIVKDPKTDTGNFKKSQSGYCVVFHDENNKLSYRDGLISSDTPDNVMVPVFRDGAPIQEYSLSEIREQLHKETGFLGVK